MKILFIAIMMATMSSFAQTTTVKLQKVYDLDANTKEKVTYKETGSVAIYHNKTLPVYITSKGKLFIWVVSEKSGKKYKKYIK
jgi:hypothetical protein